MSCSNKMGIDSYQLTEIEPIPKYKTLVFDYIGMIDPKNPRDIKKALSEAGIENYSGIYYYAGNGTYIVFWKEE